MNKTYIKTYILKVQKFDIPVVITYNSKDIERVQLIIDMENETKEMKNFIKNNHIGLIRFIRNHPEECIIRNKYIKQYAIEV